MVAIPIDPRNPPAWPEIERMMREGIAQGGGFVEVEQAPAPKLNPFTKARCENPELIDDPERVRKQTLLAKEFVERTRNNEMMRVLVTMKGGIQRSLSVIDVGYGRVYAFQWDGWGFKGVHDWTREIIHIDDIEAVDSIHKFLCCDGMPFYE